MSLIEARGLSRDFVVPRRSAFARTRRQTALTPTDLDVAEGSSVGIIGESGSGKSTLVRLLLGLDVPTAGTVEVGGRRVDAAASARSLHWLRRETGLVFQDPYASLDPRMSAEQIIREPLWALGIEGDHAARVREVLLQVGLEPEMAERYPHEFSGGQRQRIALARALASEAPVLVLHDPTTAVDSVTEARIARGIAEVRGAHATILLTSSPVLLDICDRVIEL